MENTNTENSLFSNLLTHSFHFYMRLYENHWNVTGENFISIHRYLQEMFEAEIGFIDLVAEKMRTKGYIAECNIKKSTLTDKVESYDVEYAIENTISDIDVLLPIIRAIYPVTDSATVSMLNDYEDFLTKSKWFLTSSKGD